MSIRPKVMRRPACVDHAECRFPRDVPDHSDDPVADDRDVAPATEHRRVVDHIPALN
jgi:hypothetical protein